MEDSCVKNVKSKNQTTNKKTTPKPNIKLLCWERLSFNYFFFSCSALLCYVVSLQEPGLNQCTGFCCRGEMIFETNWGNHYSILLLPRQ